MSDNTDDGDDFGPAEVRYIRAALSGPRAPTIVPGSDGIKTIAGYDVDEFFDYIEGLEERVEQLESAIRSALPENAHSRGDKLTAEMASDRLRAVIDDPCATPKHVRYREALQTIAEFGLHPDGDPVDLVRFRRVAVDALND